MVITPSLSSSWVDDAVIVSEAVYSIKPESYTRDYGGCELVVMTFMNLLVKY